LRTKREVGSRSMVTAMVRSVGGGDEVDSGSATMTKSLRKRMAVACFGAGDEVAACSGSEIKDGRWRWWRSSFYGDNRARESVRSKNC
jgi:hypothetical protein